MDRNFGRIEQLALKENIGRGRARQSVPFREERQQMSLFEKFITAGAEELAKDGAIWDGGFMAQARASTIQQEREEVYGALQYAASCHCFVEEWKDCEELKPKSPHGVVCCSK